MELQPNRTRSRAINRKFWHDINVDLRGATLIDFSMIGCSVAAVDFTGHAFTAMPTSRAFDSRVTPCLGGRVSMARHFSTMPVFI
jgi:hypothetical protein